METASPISRSTLTTRSRWKPDLSVVNAGSSNLSVLLGLGGGRFAIEMPFATGMQPEALAIHDLNADGRPDLVVANETSNSVSVLLTKCEP